MSLPLKTALPRLRNSVGENLRVSLRNNAPTLAGYVLIACSVLIYQIYYAHYPLLPLRAAMDSGWWNWADQGRYYREAQAWASGDLRPSEHWYLPLYTLLGALCVPFSRVNPFWLPDIICFAATGLLLSALAPRLMPGMPRARFFGALAFVVADISFPPHYPALKSWVEPWTSTLVAPLMLGLLLAALRLREQPREGRAVLCGSIWGLVAMTRPTEAVWSSLPAILLCATTVLNTAGSRGLRARLAGWGLGASVVVVGLTVLLHYLVWGWCWGDYFEQSLGTGFDLGLLPFRWVWLVLDPRPAHEHYPGLATVFPWVLPGLAGILACMLASKKTNRPVHLAVGGAVIVHWVVYLSYRDLHPEGLWRYGNFHYFKWTQGLLFLYGIFLVAYLGTSRSRRIAAGVSIAAVSFTCCWQVRLAAIPGRSNAVTVTGAHELVVTGGLSELNTLLFVPTPAHFDEIYGGPQGLDQAGRAWGYNMDFKAWPLPGGLAMMPLRTLPGGDAVIRLAPGVSITAGAEPRLMQPSLAFAVPCFVATRRPSCQLPAW